MEAPLRRVARAADRLMSVGERPPTPASHHVRRRPDPRLPAYLVGGFVALFAGIATGRYELVAVGAPFLVLLVRGLTARSGGAVEGGVSLDTERVIEGDTVSGVVTLNWEGAAEVDVTLADSRGITPVEPSPVIGWSLPTGSGPVRLPFRLEAGSWGVHDLGSVWVRLRRRGSFVVAEQRVAVAPTLRVLPTELRLGRLLKPGEPRAVAGAHLARARGHGTDFAELRPYRPGDRLRDLSWGTSARLGAPWVRVNHPERTGTVLLVLDSVFGAGGEGTEGLARAARAAWAVASVHLRAQDRVGLLALGRTTAWLPPRGGRRARWMLLDELLSVGRAAADPSRRRRRRGRIAVPSDALIVGVTNLRSQTFAPDLVHHRRAGHTVVALVIDTSDLLPTADDRVDLAAQRLWIGQRDAERHLLERAGVPTAVVRSGESVGGALLSLRRRTTVGGSRRSAVGAAR